MTSDALVSDADLLRISGFLTDERDAEQRMELILALRAVADYVVKLASSARPVAVVSPTMTNLDDTCRVLTAAGYAVVVTPDRAAIELLSALPDASRANAIWPPSVID